MNYCIHPLFRLTYDRPSDVYQSSDYLISHVRRDIHITVKFPATIVSIPYALYRLRYFPVAMAGGTDHTTILHTDVKELLRTQWHLSTTPNL